jgi:pyruvate formate lyase activating enzyme
MTISGLVKSSFVDYPGLISSVLFVPGCNYNCFYCHNRSLLSGPYEIIRPDYIRNFLNSRKGLIDAVVVTGGEPTLQKDLIPFLKEIKSLGFKLKLDTNGSSPQVILSLLEQNLCDYFAVDYKAPKEQYPEISGTNSSGETVLQTISILLEHKADFEVRTTVFPQLNQDDLVKMANELPVSPRYVLNHYKKPELYLPCDHERINETSLTKKQIQAIVERLKKFQPNIISLYT